MDLDHVEKVSDSLLLDDGQGVKVTAEEFSSNFTNFTNVFRGGFFLLFKPETVRKLGFVQPRPACHLKR